MTDQISPLAQFSDALAALVAGAAPSVATIHLRHGRHLTALRWVDDLVVASEQALPKRERFPVRFHDGAECEGEVLGRDEGSNVALLRLSGAAGTAILPPAATVRTGELAVAIGARRDGAVTARLGAVHQVGPEWQSSHGGRIDAYLRLDLDLSSSEEGGPALNAHGAVIGMTTFGPRGQVLVIPHATLTRVVPILASAGKVARGWLGAALQPVAVPELPGEDSRYGRGLMVMAVTAGSPAAAGGLVSGDILLTIDDQPAGHVSHLAARLGADSIGSTLALRVLRGGEVVATQVTVAERPAE